MKYIHGVIPPIWLLLVIVTGLKSFRGTNVLPAAAYLFLIYWYIAAWRRGDQLNNFIRIFAIMALTLWLLFLWGHFSRLFLPLILEDEAITLRRCYIMSNEFMPIFLTTLVLSPLLISIFREKYFIMSLVAIAPTYIFTAYIKFDNANSASFTIGLLSAKIIGVMAALHISSAILHRIIKVKTYNLHSDFDRE